MSGEATTHGKGWKRRPENREAFEAGFDMIRTSSRYGKSGATQKQIEKRRRSDQRIADAVRGEKK